MPPRYRVVLNSQEREYLEGITKRGKHDARTIRYCFVMRAQLDQHGRVVPLLKPWESLIEQLST